MPLVLDHLVPRTAGGRTQRENLWLACYRCNEFKGARTGGADPATGEYAPLFNPRRDAWREHFVWVDGGRRVAGLTASGRVTVRLLRLNNSHIVRARRSWVQAGWHPPPGV